MTPILYSENETSFSSLGLGMLHESVRCVVTEERNGLYELELKYPENGSLFEFLKHSAIIKAVPEYGKPAQLFRIYDISKPMKGLVTYRAEHISYQLSYIPLSPFTASRVPEALHGIKENSDEDNPFTFWTDKTTEGNFEVTLPISARSSLGGISGSILDVYGGEFEFDNYTVKLWNSRGQDRGVLLSYGKNITDIQQEESIANTITGVCPYWTSEEVTVTLPERVVYSEYADSYPFKRTIVRDFSNEFSEPPTIEQLRAKATSYIRQNSIGIPKVSIKISFLTLQNTEEYKNIPLLESVQLCDIVTVRFEKLGISQKAKVVRVLWDCLQEQYESVEIGSVRASLSNAITEVAEDSKIEVDASQSLLERRIVEASKQITGVNGGHLVLNQDADGKPYELLIMDTEDIATAQNVWRFNLNGFGHSSTGYEGEYRLAFTQDGHGNADFLTTGTLDADLVNVINLKAQQIFVSSSETVLDQLIQIDGSIQDLQSQIDGAIGVYYTDVEPNLLNYPAWDFTYNIPCNNTVQLRDDLAFEYTFESYRKNRSALVYNTTNGLSYRFSYDSQNNEWYWMEISNTETGLILQRLSDLEITTEHLESTYTEVRADVNSQGIAITAAQSQISQQAGQIALKVSQTDYNGTTIASLINQTADSVKIVANHIDLNGVVTANNNFKINTNGTVTAVNANISGTITTNNLTANGGTIGGWSINSSAIYRGSSSWGAQNGQYFGTNGLSFGSAFKVTPSGALTASGANISGTINASSGSFTGTVNANDGTFTNVTIAESCTIKATLNANRINAGTFSVDRIPSLNADKITAGTLDVGRIPNLNAGKITAGVLNAERISSSSQRLSHLYADEISVYSGLYMMSGNLGFASSATLAGRHPTGWVQCRTAYTNNNYILAS